ncbi:uncharacterized protein BCR38DRAFT_519522 [Pseudomassariella vexata]|uniref:Uncharacterized protein n=1 Tax=Pseudomassariella vexata TaxID=1141098 RepID=A0A1Y2EHL4_9PEZI|nr:uncharacterized protein BCR38DRAFT_519522 [Pseudomassariella vexata]ORY71053.1 hypothetical protein BCR38DRAFT_519522 [Pseudomassariella vexata]
MEVPTESLPNTGPTPAEAPSTPPTEATRGKLSKFMKARWLHPRTKRYIHALVDASICWVVGLTLAFGIIEFKVSFDDVDHSEFILLPLVRFGGYISIIFAMACGIAIGTCMQSLGLWRTQHMGPHRAKHVVFGKLRLRMWVFTCLSIALSFVLPVFGSHAVRVLSAVSWHTRGNVTFDSTSSRIREFVVLHIMCLVTLCAVTGGAIIRERRLAPLEDEKKVRDEEKGGHVKGECQVMGLRCGSTKAARLNLAATEEAQYNPQKATTSLAQSQAPAKPKNAKKNQASAGRNTAPRLADLEAKKSDVPYKDQDKPISPRS